MKALIKVGYGCNENCTFCHTADVRHVDGSAAEVHAKIDRAHRLGHTMVVLSGGEATIRPEIWEWAAHVAALGMDFGLVTNGAMLAYPEVVDRLLAYRLKYVYMSMHGGTATIHNRLVRSNTFDLVNAALGNLCGRGLDFTVNTVVAKQNVEHLRSVVDAVLSHPDVVLKFSMVQPKGRGAEHFEVLAVPVAIVAERVCDAIRYGTERRGHREGPRFAHDGIPLCLLPGYEDLYDDLKTHRFATMVEIGEADFFPVDDKAKIQTERCKGCALRGPCPGLYAGYYEDFGDAELRPVAGRPRSNSFDYVFETMVTDQANGACPLLEDGVTPWDRGRHLFVKNGERIGRFRTSSRDFPDVEIEGIKHETGQIYLDASSKAAPDDFSRDLVKLARSRMCDPCAEKARCTGMYEPVYENVFDQDDARVRDLIGGLSGDVLDVGCGEGPYEELLAPLARQGRVRYVGIDPDASRIRALEARWSWADLRTCALEALADDGARFDHVLILRSWNHLDDPARALAGLVRVLRPGGTLTIVDNVAFGLARTPAQTARARASTARFEHYRNDDAALADRCVSGFGFVLLDRREVTAATSNQWLLRYRAPSPVTVPAR